MTPTATYIAEENCLQELPQMEKPRSANEYESATVRNLLARERETYNAHLATLRKIPCENKCKEVFKDGEVYTENVHYKVCIAFDMKGENGELCAIPLVPVKSEDELWEDIVTKLEKRLKSGAKLKDIVYDFKKSYSLTKR